MEEPYVFLEAVGENESVAALHDFRLLHCRHSPAAKARTGVGRWNYIVSSLAIHAPGTYRFMRVTMVVAGVACTSEPSPVWTSGATAVSRWAI